MAASKKQILVVVLLLISLHLAIYWLSPADAFLEADTMSYRAPADALRETGSFSSETRLPGYPFLLAGILIVTKHLGAAVVMVQTLVLFVTGLVASRMSDKIMAGTGPFTLILVCFNPAASFYVQQILPDTFFAFFLILHIYFIVKASHSGSLAAAIGAGMAAGASALIRGNGEYVIWLMPVALSIAYALSHDPPRRLLICKLGAASLLAAFVVCSPWLIHNWHKGEGVAFISSAYANYSVHDNVVAAVALERNLTTRKAQEVVYGIVRQKENIEQSRWERFTASEKHQIVRSHSFYILLHSNVADLIRAIGKALFKFVFLNDGQSWAAFWQLSADQRSEPKIVSGYSLSTVLEGTSPVSPTTYACHAATLAFALLARGLGVVGFAYFVRQKFWYLLAVFGLEVALFTLSAAFIGYSRYRVPIDPILMLFGAVGLSVSLSSAVTRLGMQASRSVPNR